MIWRRPVSAAQVAEVRAGGLAQRLDDLAAIKRQLEEQAAIIEQLTGRLSGR